jgi:hypothetical protein
MPVMCIIRASKVTPETYDEVRRRVGWEADPPEGAISHAISFDQKGATEVNLWQSRELFDAYVETRLQKVLDDLGVVFDEVTILDTYNAAVGAPARDLMIPRPSEPRTLPDGPVMVVYPRTNISAELYDQFRRSLPIDTVPKGSLAHIHGRTGETVVTIDVWQDSAALSAFIHNDLIPAIEAQGIPFVWPEIIKVETLVTTPGADAFVHPFTEGARQPASELAPA